MKYTRHARVRMGQRGIPPRLIEMARKYGRDDGERWILDRKELRRVLGELDAERSLVLKAMDKGGIAVPTNGDVVITAYNL